MEEGRKKSVIGRSSRKLAGVVGYLKDGGVEEAGPEAGGRANRLVLEGWKGEVVAGVGDVFAELIEVEAAMARVGELLRRSQPGREGRLVVRWWVVRGGEVVREPTLSRMARSSRGRESFERVDQRVKAKRTGEWAVNADQVEVALRAWWPMVKRRKGLLSRLKAARLLMTRTDRADAGDWRYALPGVEDGIELACRRLAERKGA